MQLESVPAQSHQVICPQCNKYTVYSVFHSSFYKFDTYFGLSTKSLYRVDLSREQNHSSDNAKALFDTYFELEGGADNVLRVPDKVACIHSGHVFTPSNSETNGCEQAVMAFVI